MVTAGLMQGSAGRVARAPRPAVLWGLAVLACACASTSLGFALTSDHLREPGIHGALMEWITLAFVFAGLVAWWRRPESRFGVLMVVAGFGNFVSSLSSANAALPYTLGIGLDLTVAVLVLHVFLAFPTGRIERRFERVLLGVAYVVALPGQLVGMALGGFGPDNLLEVVAESEAAYTLLRGQLLALSACMLAGIAVLVVRRRTSGRPLRRRLLLLVDSFALALVMLAFLFCSAALGLVSGQLSFEVLRRVTLFAIGLAPLAFLVGLLDARLARTAVGDLLVALHAGSAPSELRPALARALRDPSVSLVYWLPQFGTWADLDGRAVELEAEQHGRAATLIDGEAGHIAALLHDPSLDDEPELLRAVAAAAAIALENARLHAELRARLDDLKGSRARLVDAGDAERRRLERNLHDGAQQRMVAIALQLRLVQGRIRQDPDAAEALVTSASDELAQSLRELRELARGIHPAVLEQGLPAALEALATRSTVPVTLTVEPTGALPERVELAAYFVACEALANVGKYAHAESVSIHLWRTSRTATLEIADDGVGGADDTRGTGLRGLADRVEALDGRLWVSSPHGGGTVVTAELPCAS